jgi:hypothetical protein
MRATTGRANNVRFIRASPFTREAIPKKLALNQTWWCCEYTPLRGATCVPQHYDIQEQTPAQFMVIPDFRQPRCKFATTAVAQLAISAGACARAAFEGLTKEYLCAAAPVPLGSSVSGKGANES